MKAVDPASFLRLNGYMLSFGMFMFVVAAFLGQAIPIGLRLLSRDPRVAAGPITLALADMITLLAYFNLARWLTG